MASSTSCRYRVQNLFQGYLRRAPDLAGSDAATNALLDGATPETVTNSLMASNEYASHR